eukprot:925638-Rhodomonas_salina.2
MAALPQIAVSFSLSLSLSSNTIHHVNTNRCTAHVSAADRIHLQQLDLGLQPLLSRTRAQLRAIQHGFISGAAKADRRPACLTRVYYSQLQILTVVN